MTKSISLRELVDGCDGLPLQGELWPEAFTLMLDGRGTLNQHLSFPVDPSTGKQKHYDRDAPLSLDSRVYGEHLLVTYLGHDPALYLTEHANLEEIKAEILGSAGSFNVWINAQFVFHNFKPLPFSIQYTDRSGIRKTFDIENREPVSDDWGSATSAIANVEFEWLFDAG